MSSVYKPIIYNVFFKEERKKNNLTTLDLSKLIYMSVGSINNFENSDDILNNDKTELFLRFYKYNSHYLKEFDKNLNDLLISFSTGVIYIDDKSVEMYFKKLSSLFSNLEDSILYSAFSLISIIYSLYHNNKIDIKILDQLINSRIYLTDKYQALANIYLGIYFTKQLDFKTSKEYFDNALFNLSKDDSFKDMYHYFIAQYYMKINDLFSSYNNREEAIKLFGKTKNYARILNTSLQLGTQFIHLGKYNKAIAIYKETLSLKEIDNYKYEKNTLLYNLAFIFMMQNRYNEALKLYSSISDDYFGQSECYSFMICLVENNDIKKAREICNYGKKLDDNNYYLYFFEIYSKYFENYDLLKLTNSINKSLKKFESSTSILEKQFIHILLAHKYKQMGKFKQATNHLEKFISLLTNDQ